MRRRDPGTVWHMCGTRMVRELIRPVLHSRCWRCDLGCPLERAKGIEPSLCRACCFYRRMGVLPAKLRDEGPKL